MGHTALNNQIHSIHPLKVYLEHQLLGSGVPHGQRRTSPSGARITINGAELLEILNFFLNN